MTSILDAGIANSKDEVCDNCGGTNFELNELQGFIPYCVQCGLTKESWEVNDTYCKGNGGGLEQQGRVIDHINGGVTGVIGGVGAGFTYNVNNISNDITLRRMKNEIKEILFQLDNFEHFDINGDVLKRATNLYQRLLEKSKTGGKLRCITECGCIYIACRQYKLPYLLIDFAKIVKINVYKLAKNFRNICDTIPIKLDTIPMKQYIRFIQRYNMHLNFKDKIDNVNQTSIKILKAMKANSIIDGRRIEGVCGCVIFISSKLNGFKRSLKRISNLVNISIKTIKQRIDEVSRTDIAKMSLDEFNADNFKQNRHWKQFKLAPAYIKSELKYKREMIAKKEESKKNISNNNNNDNTIKNQNSNSEFYKRNMDFDPYNINVKRNSNDEYVVDDFGEYKPKSDNEDENDDDIINTKDIIEDKDKNDLLNNYFSDDSEIDNMILSTNEAQIKSKIFDIENPGYNAYIKDLDKRRKERIIKKTKKSDLTFEEEINQKLRDKFVGKSDKIDYVKLEELLFKDDANDDNDSNYENKNNSNTDDNNSDNEFIINDMCNESGSGGFMDFNPYEMMGEMNEFPLMDNESALNNDINNDDNDYEPPRKKQRIK